MEKGYDKLNRKMEKRVSENLWEKENIMQKD